MSEFDTLIGLVSHYSPSGQEHDAVQWLVGRMRSLGYDEAFIDDAGNAIGVMGQGPKQVVLLGHIDTVAGEIKVEQVDGSLFGRGTVDAKGPLACFVDTVAHVSAVEGWQFVVIGAVDEERNSEGARFIVDQYQPEFAIIGEPNQWDRLALGYKGNAWSTLTFRRGQTHTASGEETAAEAAVDGWLKIKAYADSFNADQKKAFDKLLPTLNAIEAESGAFDQCARLRVGVRLPVEISPDKWYQILQEILPDAKLERSGFAVPAWVCEKNTLLVRAFLSGIRSEGGEPRFVYKTGTADLNIVAPAWNCPALVYGPGDSSLDHTPNEHILLEEYERSARVLGNALIRLTKSPRRQNGLPSFT
jgi:LysW-gamma-L-lysine carboxypeptidase